MSCPGLHCPGCPQGQSLGILAGTGAVLLVAYETVAVVAEYIVPIAVTVVVCFALSVAAAVWLERVNDRRAASWGAARGILSRADVILPEPRSVCRQTDYPTTEIRHAVADYPAEIRTRGSDSSRPAIPAPSITFNFFGPLSTEQAELVRKAINGRN